MQRWQQDTDNIDDAAFRQIAACSWFCRISDAINPKQNALTFAMRRTNPDFGYWRPDQFIWYLGSEMYGNEDTSSNRFMQEAAALCAGLQRMRAAPQQALNILQTQGADAAGLPQDRLDDLHLIEGVLHDIDMYIQYVTLFTAASGLSGEAALATALDTPSLTPYVNNWIEYLGMFLIHVTEQRGAEIPIRHYIPLTAENVQIIADKLRAPPPPRVYVPPATRLTRITNANAIRIFAWMMAKYPQRLMDVFHPYSMVHRRHRLGLFHAQAILQLITSTPYYRLPEHRLAALGSARLSMLPSDVVDNIVDRNEWYSRYPRVPDEEDTP